MNMIRLTMDRALVSNTDLCQLYMRSGFGDLSQLLDSQGLDKIFSNNAFSFFAINANSGALLGAARVLSDDLITSYLAEICVDPAWRSKGIGDHLLQAVITRFNHTALFTCGFKGMESYLGRQGLTEKPKLFACSRRPYMVDINGTTLQ